MASCTGRANQPDSAGTGRVPAATTVGVRADRFTPCPWRAIAPPVWPHAAESTTSPCNYYPYRDAPEPKYLATSEAACNCG